MIYEPGEGLESREYKSFRDDTRYEIVEQSGRTVIRAVSERSASALYHEKAVNLRETPCLNWKWRVENVLPVTDPEQKAGDDYRAGSMWCFVMGSFPGRCGR